MLRASRSYLKETYGQHFLHQVKEAHPEWYTALLDIENCETRGTSDLVGPAVFARRKLRIPAGKEMDLRCRIITGVQKHTYTALIESHTPLGLPNGLLIAKVLANVKKGYAPIRVMNMSQRSLTIRPQTPLAHAFLVENVVEFPDKTGPSEAVQNSESLKQAVPDSLVDLRGAATDTEEQRMLLKELIDKNKDVFSWHPTDYGHTKTVQHEIPLVDSKPFRLPYRKIPPSQWQDVRKLLIDMEAAGVIRPSKSPYASPVVVVTKKDGPLRLCIDYRKLNSCSTRDAFPLPRIEEALEALGQAKYFSTLDLTSGYWQVEVAEQDKHKTAFSTPVGLFEANRMPFGLQNAPATFQRLMTCCFGDLNFTHLLIYLDDLIIFAKTFDEHLERLQLVFDRLRQHGLKLKPSKCQLVKKEVQYLGHIVSSEGIKTDPEKISKVKNWPRPTSRKEVLQFLGFVGYYRRYVSNFSSIAAPLFCLTSGDPRKKKRGTKKATVPAPVFAWTDLCEHAFQLLKDPENNPLKYVMSSAKLDATGQRWVSQLSIFDFDIEYRKGKNNANADALPRMSNQDVAIALQSCPQQVTSSPQKPVGTPEMSDVPQPVSSADENFLDIGTESLPAMTINEICLAQKEDSVVGPVLFSKSRNQKPSRSERAEMGERARLLLKEWGRLVIRNGVLFRKVKDIQRGNLEQLILPEMLHTNVKTTLHDDSGHLGFERTLQMIRERFYWPKMFQEIKAWCEQCERCCLRKTPTAGVRAPLVSIHTSAPMELVCVDFLTLEKSRGGIANVLIVMDHFSRYAHAYPTRDQKAGTVARTLWKNFFCRFGFPAKLHADQGRNFESAVAKELYKCVGIEKTHTTPYHPQGNGTTERFNRTLMNMLGTLEPHQMPRWHEHVDAMTHAYNCTQYDSTGYTPYFLMFGRHPRLPVDLIFGLSSPSNPCEYSEYVQTLHDALSKAYTQASQSSHQAKQMQKKHYDKRAKGQVFSPGDRVLVKVCHVEGRQKLGDRWEAHPYIVVKKQPNVPVYVIRREGGEAERVVHRNLLTQCMFLPVQRQTETPEGHEHATDVENDQPDIQSVQESDTEDNTGPDIAGQDQLSTEEVERVAGLLEEEVDPAVLPQRPNTPRRNPRRERRPPKRLSYETQVTMSDQEMIEMGREIWHRMKEKKGVCLMAETPSIKEGVDVGE